MNGVSVRLVCLCHPYIESLPTCIVFAKIYVVRGCFREVKIMQPPLLSGHFSLTKRWLHYTGSTVHVYVLWNVYTILYTCTCILCCHGNDRFYIFEYTHLIKINIAYKPWPIGVYMYVSYTPAYVRKFICDTYICILYRNITYKLLTSRCTCMSAHIYTPLGHDLYTTYTCWIICIFLD